MPSRTLIPCALLAVVFLTGCRKHSGASDEAAAALAGQGAPILKVAVFVDGRLKVDGAPASIRALHDALRRLSAQHGVIWYYREAAQDEPPPIAMQVMKELADSQLPLRLSSRPDYSDSVAASPPPSPAQ